MIPRLKVVMLVVIVCVAPSMALADDLTEDYAQYVGIQVTGLLEQFDDEGGLFDFENTFGLGARLGLRIDGKSDSKDYALELNVNWYSSIDVEDVTGLVVTPGAKFAEFDAISFMLRSKIYATTLGSGKFEPYAYAGIGFLNGEAKETVTGLGLTVEETEFAFEFGAGGELNITDSVSFFTEVGYFLPTGDLDDFSFVTVGGGLIFSF